MLNFSRMKFFVLLSISGFLYSFALHTTSAFSGNNFESMTQEQSIVKPKSLKQEISRDIEISHDSELIKEDHLNKQQENSELSKIDKVKIKSNDNLDIKQNIEGHENKEKDGNDGSFEENSDKKTVDKRENDRNQSDQRPFVKGPAKERRNEEARDKTNTEIFKNEVDEKNKNILASHKKKSEQPEIMKQSIVDKYFLTCAALAKPAVYDP